MNLLFLALAGLAAQYTPERRALDYLAREVPRWAEKNKCYSCHNNGDAARTLYLAQRLGWKVPQEALADTTGWLKQPQRWDENKADPAYNDKHLARLQFAVALHEAVAAGVVEDRKGFLKAAEILSTSQQKDGAWQIGAEGTVGGSVTYGPVLATGLARNVLEAADPVRFGPAIERSQRWLMTVEVKTVLDAAAVLLTLSEQKPTTELTARRKRCLTLLKEGQFDRGGWGPFLNSPPEPFDTAVVLLALVPLKDDVEVQAMIAKGRAYLIATQRWDGSWPETTRPAGAESYAQRVSTTAWAARALLLTR